MKFGKVILFAIAFMFSCSFFQVSFANIYDKFYWERWICFEYSDREWSCADAVAALRARASYLDRLIKKIIFFNNVESLRASGKLPGKLFGTFGLEHEIKKCVGVSFNDYEILSNLENMRDAYSTLSLYLESTDKNRRYSF